MEEFGPILHYISGEANVVADAVSRLDLIPDITSEEQVARGRTQLYLGDVLFNTHLSNNQTRGKTANRNARRSTVSSVRPQKEKQKDKSKLIDDPPTRIEPNQIAPFLDKCPICYETISKHQMADSKLMEALNNNLGYKIKAMDQNQIVFNKDGLMPVPKILREPILSWYHINLCHPGVDRTEETIRRNFVWVNLREDVRAYINKCDPCQRLKKHTKKYGELPPKVAEAKPWHKLCVDLIGPYKVRTLDGEVHNLHALTMIDPATSWFEICEIPDKSSETISLLVDRMWFNRYPRPLQVSFDQGGEFTGNEFQDLLESYGIKPKPSTSRNPQSNGVIERVHQTLHNMLRTFDLQLQRFDPIEPWQGYLSAVAFGIRSTYHTTLKATPAELVYGRDMIFNRSHLPNWDLIRRQKQALIIKNNMRENSNRIKHKYRVGDLVLYHRRTKKKQKHERPYDGPFEILQVYDNGTVMLQRNDRVKQRCNIPLIHPYKT